MSESENLKRLLESCAANGADARFNDVVKSVVALLNEAYIEDPAWAIHLAAGLCLMAMGHDLDARIAMAEKSKGTLQ